MMLDPFLHVFSVYVSQRFKLISVCCSWGGLLFISCGLLIFSVGALVVLGLVLFYPLPLNSWQESRSPLSSLLLLSSAFEKSAVGTNALLVVATCYDCIV
jgi:hypothetical protein